MQVELKKSEEMLKESIRMLLYEPKNTPEGHLTISLLKELKDLQFNIKSLTESKTKKKSQKKT